MICSIRLWDSLGPEQTTYKQTFPIDHLGTKYPPLSNLNLIWLQRCPSQWFAPIQPRYLTLFIRTSWLVAGQPLHVKRPSCRPTLITRRYPKSSKTIAQAHHKGLPQHHACTVVLPRSLARLGRKYVATWPAWLAVSLVIFVRAVVLYWPKWILQ